MFACSIAYWYKCWLHGLCVTMIRLYMHVWLMIRINCTGWTKINCTIMQSLLWAHSRSVLLIFVIFDSDNKFTIFYRNAVDKIRFLIPIQYVLRYGESKFEFLYCKQNDAMVQFLLAHHVWCRSAIKRSELHVCEFQRVVETFPCFPHDTVMLFDDALLVGTVQLNTMTTVEPPASAPKICTWVGVRIVVLVFSGEFLSNMIRQRITFYKHIKISVSVKCLIRLSSVLCVLWQTGWG